MPSPLPFPLPARARLRADCRRCDALCCTLLAFTRSADFAADKPAGTPCRNLAGDRSCTIHASLHGHGYAGCAAFDCFGAGQALTRSLRTSARTAPQDPRRLLAEFSALRRLHEMLWHLAEAHERTHDPDAADRLEALARRIAGAAGGETALLRDLDLDHLHREAGAVLADVSAEVRARYGAADGAAPMLGARADLAGRDLRRRVLHGADLRGALLIAADLRGTDLAGADLLGADLRDARLHGADLSRALFVSRSQISAARGDGRTLLPADVPAPGHWAG